MDRGAWWATIHRVAKSQTWLKQQSAHTYTVVNVWHYIARTSGRCKDMAATPPDTMVLILSSWLQDFILKKNHGNFTVAFITGQLNSKYRIKGGCCSPGQRLVGLEQTSVIPPTPSMGKSGQKKVGSRASLGLSSWFSVHLTSHIDFCFFLICFGAPLVAQMVKNPLAMQETTAQSLGREDPLEKGMATHSSILAWRISWTEEPGGL